MACSSVPSRGAWEWRRHEPSWGSGRGDQSQRCRLEWVGGGRLVLRHVGEIGGKGRAPVSVQRLLEEKYSGQEIFLAEFDIKWPGALLGALYVCLKAVPSYGERQRVVFDLPRLISAVSMGPCCACVKHAALLYFQKSWPQWWNVPIKT
ncbi:hypothetical protein SRHO_G00126610 [Serrasalmus rhombeus]